MSASKRLIEPEKIKHQLEVAANIKSSQTSPKYAYCATYGCQQNVADSERLKGYLSAAGYQMTDSAANADLIILNTCAVREHAEKRVFGTIGEYSHLKDANPGLIIAVCGCMAEQEHIKEKIKKSYPCVDMVFGPHELWRFPELLNEKLSGAKRRIFTPHDISGGSIAEDIPSVRDGGVTAWLSIMYGCNNFCTYCIVPYVRGRERSRSYDAIEKEFRELLALGYKDITLLGQNVNSYGKDLDDGITFPELLDRLASIDGEFKLRFMTSHPKDASHELFSVMAAHPKIARHIHLPFQSGSDSILKRMNRRYTADEYLALIDDARSLMPDIVFTSDVIVGFPDETEEDFVKTLELVEKVRFVNLFTFIYSKRNGTPAATMPDSTSDEEKHNRFDRLLKLQNKISEEEHQKYIGNTLRALIDGKSKDPEFNLTARTDGGRLINVKGDDSHIGKFTDIKITKCSPWALFGEVVQ